MGRIGSARTHCNLKAEGRTNHRSQSGMAGAVLTFRPGFTDGGSALVARRLRTMKTCSYCGKQYPDDAEVCELDQQPLKGPAKSAAGVASPKVTCPQCGAADDFTAVIDTRGSFSLTTFLLGGLIAVLFQNAGKARRVRCNRCEARFFVSSRLSRLSRVIFWLLVTPTIICLGLLLIMLIHTLFSD